MRPRGVSAMHGSMFAALLILVHLPGASMAAAQEAAAPRTGSLTDCAEFGPDGPTAEPPFTTPPRLLNAARAAALAQQASAHLGTERRMADVWFLVDAEGSLRDVRILKSSGSARADTLMLGLARELRFAPASMNSAPVCLWFARPIVIGGG